MQNTEKDFKNMFEETQMIYPNNLDNVEKNQHIILKVKNKEGTSDIYFKNAVADKEPYLKISSNKITFFYEDINTAETKAFYLLNGLLNDDILDSVKIRDEETDNDYKNLDHKLLYSFLDSETIDNFKIFSSGYFPENSKYHLITLLNKEKDNGVLLYLNIENQKYYIQYVTEVSHVNLLSHLLSSHDFEVRDYIPFNIFQGGIEGFLKMNLNTDTNTLTIYDNLLIKNKIKNNKNSTLFDINYDTLIIDFNDLIIESKYILSKELNIVSSKQKNNHYIFDIETQKFLRAKDDMSNCIFYSNFSQEFENKIKDGVIFDEFLICKNGDNFDLYDLKNENLLVSNFKEKEFFVSTGHVIDHLISYDANEMNGGKYPFYIKKTKSLNGFMIVRDYDIDFNSIDGFVAHKIFYFDGDDTLGYKDLGYYKKIFGKTFYSTELFFDTQKNIEQTKEYLKILHFKIIDSFLKNESNFFPDQNKGFPYNYKALLEFSELKPISFCKYNKTFTIIGKKSDNESYLVKIYGKKFGGVNSSMKIISLKGLKFYKVSSSDVLIFEKNKGEYYFFDSYLNMIDSYSLSQSISYKTKYNNDIKELSENDKDNMFQYMINFISSSFHFKKGDDKIILLNSNKDSQYKKLHYIGGSIYLSYFDTGYQTDRFVNIEKHGQPTGFIQEPIRCIYNIKEKTFFQKLKNLNFNENTTIINSDRFDDKKQDFNDIYCIYRNIKTGPNDIFIRLLVNILNDKKSFILLGKKEFEIIGDQLLYELGNKAIKVENIYLDDYLLENSYNEQNKKYLIQIENDGFLLEKMDKYLKDINIVLTMKIIKKQV